MSFAQTATRTASFTTTDIGTVVRRFTADLKMMGSSSGTLSEQKADDYGHDVETLAAVGYLKSVDVTLMDANEAEQAREVLGDIVDASPRPLNKPLSSRIFLLGIEAWKKDLLSEGQLAELLKLDRQEVRALLAEAEAEQDEADGGEQAVAHRMRSRNWSCHAVLESC